LHDLAIRIAQGLRASLDPSIDAIAAASAKSVHERFAGPETIQCPAKHDRKVVRVSDIPCQGFEILDTPR
jgi:hypothetical protein